MNVLEMSWGRRLDRCAALLRCFPIVLLATMHLAAFGVAGLFSSKAITNSDNEVLARSASCGWMDEEPLTGRTTPSFDDAARETADAFLVTTRWSVRRGYDYARSCYGDLLGATDGSTCNIYVKPSINSITTTAAPCPFPGRVCATDAVTIDSGYIDSDRHLGINVHEKDRISIRKVLSCAPLLGEKYTQGWFQPPASAGVIPNNSYKAYYFGPRLSDAATNRSSTEYTFTISNFSLHLAQSEYHISYASYFPTNESASQFTPIPELLASQADIFLMGLENRAVYPNMVEDPWFEASIRSRSKFFTASKDLSFLGCIERYQFCTNSEAECSPLTGFYSLSPDPSQNFDLSATQRAVFRLLWKAVEGMSLYVTLMILNKDPLLANNYLWGGGGFTSSPLPGNHWQSEVRNIFNASLALLQQRVVEYASPPVVEFRPGISSLKHVVRPTDSEALRLCDQVKILTTNYTSFSFLGVVLTLLAGGIIISTNMSLPTVVSWVQLKRGKGLHQRLEWIETNGLQLQRMACEGRGIGPWSGREDYAPSTVVVGQKFSLTKLSLEHRNRSSSEYELLDQTRGAPYRSFITP